MVYRQTSKLTFNLWLYSLKRHLAFCRSIALKPTHILHTCLIVGILEFCVLFWKLKWVNNLLKLKSVLIFPCCVYFNIERETNINDNVKLAHVTCRTPKIKRQWHKYSKSNCLVGILLNCFETSPLQSKGDYLHNSKSFEDITHQF